jgi:hypothetical protein
VSQSASGTFLIAGPAPCLRRRRGRRGVEAIVNMSQISARPDHLSPAARQHWLAERVFDWTGLGITHLRPPFFLEDLLVFAATVRRESQILLPYGHGKHAPVCGEDLARVIVGILLDPMPHRGKTCTPTGPRSLTMAESGPRRSVQRSPLAAVFARLIVEQGEHHQAPAGGPPLSVAAPICGWARKPEVRGPMSRELTCRETSDLVTDAMEGRWMTLSCSHSGLISHGARRAGCS